MNRRTFLRAVPVAVASTAGFSWSAALRQARQNNHAELAFPLSLALPPRHRYPTEIAADLVRYRTRGYTGIWIEDDYVRWALKKDPDQGFDGCWRLFNVFDFTFSEVRDLYRSYLTELSHLCKQQKLGIWASFWVPLPNAEMMRYLRQHRPKAIGRVTLHDGPHETLCTCRDGEGLVFLGEMFERFLEEFPQIEGLKIATEDNGARICDETCPNAHGTAKADHAGNLFGEIQRTLNRQQRHVQLMLYPWFWKTGFREKILEQLTRDYLVMTKMEERSRQNSPFETSGGLLFDDSIVSEQAGTDFQQWISHVGPSRIIDMVPVGSSVDDIFFNYPPYPGRLYRRFHFLRSEGVTRFLDFECGSHSAGSNEEAVAVFSQDPNCSEAALLQQVAQRLYSRAAAWSNVIQGWRAFDKGFGDLPIGLDQTGIGEFSGRIGFAWPMCIATPVVASAFSDRDRKHEIFWFSPYNFFTFSVAPRLKEHFSRVLEHWNASLRAMQAAHRIEGTSKSNRELVAVKAHCLGAQSVLNWCAAAHLASTPSASLYGAKADKWTQIMRAEFAVTKEFQSLLATDPWVWSNPCWHPNQTVLHQKLLGFTSSDRDPFVAKIRIMEAAFYHPVTRQPL